MKNKILDYSTEGIPIFYDKEADTITFKGTKVSASLIIKSFESKMDRVEILPNLWMYYENNMVSFGCLELRKEQVIKLIKSICTNN